MNLNDAFGHAAGMKVIYNHHEQACAIAAESYARIHNKIALVCVTTGPGGTNAMTGVLGGYLDSIPFSFSSSSNAKNASGEIPQAAAHNDREPRPSRYNVLAFSTISFLLT